MKPHPGGMCNSKVKLMDFINRLDHIELRIKEAPSKRRASLKEQREGILKSIQTLSAYLNQQGKLSSGERKKLYKMGYLTTSDFGVDL